MKYHQGIYRLKNPKKYKGNPDNVIFRSGWEKSCFIWCDTNPRITEWSSEEVVVAYVYEVDNKFHRYYVDLKFTMNKQVYLVEIKPKKETEVPKNANKSKRYINESLTYIKNCNKWEAAEKYAKKRGWKFQIWTEDTLTAMGIMPKKLGKVPGKMKKLKPLRRPKKPAKRTK